MELKMEKVHNHPRKVIGALAVVLLGTTLMLPSNYPQGILIPKEKGTVSENITDVNLQKTVCVKGYSAKVRPKENYTQSVRKYLNAKPTDVLDHAISIELGGQPQDLNNLWLEPKHIIYKGTDLGSTAKDQVENYLHSEVCKNNISLSQAQSEIRNWPEIYLRIKGKLGSMSTQSDD